MSTDLRTPHPPSIADPAAPLPPRWRDCFAPMGVTVPCRGETHRVTWTPAGVETPDHDADAEAAFVALGGEPSGCAAVAALWDLPPDHPCERYGGGLWTPQVGWWSLPEVPMDAVVPAGEERAFAARSGARGAVRYLCEEALVGWLSGLGVPVDSVEVEVQVGPGNHAFLGAEESPRIGLHATWAPDAPLRALVMVNESWYDEACAEGAVRDGRLWLGNNGSVDVLGGVRVVHAAAHPSDEEFEVPHLLALGVPAASAPDPLTPDAVAEAVAVVAGSSLPEADRGLLFVGGYANFDYDDNNYWRTGGMDPHRGFTSARDARLWAQHANVAGTYSRSSPLFYEYAEDGALSMWPIDVDFDEADAAAVAAAAVAAGVPLSDCSIDFAEVAPVPGPR